MPKHPGQACAGRTLATAGYIIPNRAFRCTRPQHPAKGSHWIRSIVGRASVSMEYIFPPHRYLSERHDVRSWAGSSLSAGRVHIPNPRLSRRCYDPDPVIAGRACAVEGYIIPNTASQCTAMGDPGAHAGQSQPLWLPKPPRWSVSAYRFRPHGWSVG